MLNINRSGIVANPLMPFQLYAPSQRGFNAYQYNLCLEDAGRNFVFAGGVCFVW